MNPDLLAQLRSLFAADATSAPKGKRQPVPVMRERMANEMPIAPEPTTAQKAVSVAQEFVPGLEQGIGARRVAEDIASGRPGRAALESALLVAGAVPVVGDAAAPAIRQANRASEMRRIAPRAVPAENQQAFNKFFGESKVRTPEGAPMPMVHGTAASRLGEGIDEVVDFKSFRLPKEGRGQLGVHIASDPRQSDYFTSYDPYSGMFSERWPKATPDEQMMYSYNNIKSYGRSIPLYARVQNPLRLPDLGEWTPPRVLEAMRETNPEAYERVTNVMMRQNKDAEKLTEGGLRKVLESAGYDGIVYSNRYEGLPISVAMELQKRKDALGDMPGTAKATALDQALRQMWPEVGDAYIVFRPNQLKSAVGNRGTFDRRYKDLTLGIGGLMAARAAQPSQQENP